MTYNFNMFGIKAKGNNPLELLILIPCGLILGWIIGCIVLYSIVNLLGILEFSYINGIYTIILLLTLTTIFSGNK